jgi:phage replication-related protein YjqB (UPF0714/DUF867 family)
MEAPNDATHKSIAVVRVGVGGIPRLGGVVNRGCIGIVSRATFADFTATASSMFLSRFGKDFVARQTALTETLVGDGDAIAILAPHGGDIEKHTDLQTIRVYEELLAAGKSVRRWMCQGKKKGGDAKESWHITSAEISPLSFPELGVLFKTKFAHAVAFHGWDRDYVGVGGGAPELFRLPFVTAIERVVGKGNVCLAEYPPEKYKDAPLAGRSPDNIVNKISGDNGVQIEQPKGARADLADRIAAAVAGVYLTL